MDLDRVMNLMVRSTKGNSKSKGQQKQNGPKRVPAADSTFLYVYILLVTETATRIRTEILSG